MKEELQEIKIILARIEVDLRHHIRRTDILEESLKPIQDHVTFIRNLGKFIVGLAAVAVAVAAFLALT
ncbi:MAG: hypothetical protein GTN69_09180 [Armatimonadetes bacterium]|nr:hypothetical protein [Armatimonadota bacterium]